MTEEDAHQRWCPFARLPNGVNHVSPSMVPSTQASIRDGSHCIASECMAWRWINYGQRHGFCGLGGPEAAAPTGG
jgi:hypothetical protein